MQPEALPDDMRSGFSVGPASNVGDPSSTGRLPYLAQLGSQTHEEVAEAARFPAENPNPVFRVAADGRVLYANRASRGLLRSWHVAATGCLPPEWHERCAQALRNGQPGTWDAACEERTLQLTCVPVTQAGYVNVYASDVTERHQAEKAKDSVLEELRASQAELTRELADMQELQRISTRLIQEENAAALWDQILDAAISLMRSDMGSIQAFDPDSGDLRLLAWRGFAPETAAFWARVVQSQSTCHAAMETRVRVVMPDVEACGPAVGPPDLEHFRLSGIRGMQSTPLLARGGHPVGVISTHWRVPHQMSEREGQLMDVLARQAADLLERARMRMEREAALASLLTTAEALQAAHDELERRVTERTAELAASREELRAYARQVVEATENERRVLTHEVHGAAAQSLWALKLGLAGLRDKINDEDRFAADFERVGQFLDRAMVDVHRLATYLQPVGLYLYGLVAALQQRIKAYREWSGLEVEFTAVGLKDVQLPAEVEIALYQVVQEALNNAQRHGAAQHVRVALEYRDGRVRVTIQDDGRGFDVAEVLKSEGPGLLGMRERATMLGGELTIMSSPGHGTEIDLEILLQRVSVR